MCQLNGMAVKHKVVIMRANEMLGKFKPIFSCLDVYGQENTECMKLAKESFKKVNRRKHTIVLEMMNVLVKLLSPD